MTKELSVVASLRLMVHASHQWPIKWLVVTALGLLICGVATWLGLSALEEYLEGMLFLDHTGIFGQFGQGHVFDLAVAKHGPLPVVA
jgi:hypothetical protein